MKFTKSLLLVCVIIVVLSFSGCGTSKTEDTLEDTLDRIRNATVMVTVGEDHATGVIVGNDNNFITIATVSHLLNGYDQGIITFFNGKAGFADVKSCNAVLDVCILAIDTRLLDSDFVSNIVPVNIADDKLEEVINSDKVLIVGSSVGVAQNTTEGTLADKDYYVPEFDQRMLYLYADVTPGMSGSGVYTMDGYLIGIIAGGSDNSEAVCININNVLSEWRK